MNRSCERPPSTMTDEHAFHNRTTDSRHTQQDFVGTTTSTRVAVTTFDELLYQIKLMFDDTHRRINAVLSSYSAVSVTTTRTKSDLENDNPLCSSNATSTNPTANFHNNKPLNELPVEDQHKTFKPDKNQRVTSVVFDFHIKSSQNIWLKRFSLRRTCLSPFTSIQRKRHLATEKSTDYRGSYAIILRKRRKCEPVREHLYKYWRRSIHYLSTIHPSLKDSALPSYRFPMNPFLSLSMSIPLLKVKPRPYERYYFPF